MPKARLAPEREVAMKKRFLDKSGLINFPIEQRSGGLFGFPDSIVYVDDVSVLVEFKLGLIRDEMLVFTGKHGFKASQIEFFRRFHNNTNADAGMIVGVAQISKDYVNRGYRYFWRYRPPHWFMKKANKYGWNLGELKEITPASFEQDVRDSRSNFRSIFDLDFPVSDDMALAMKKRRKTYVGR